MPIQDKNTLKSYFNMGDRPTEQNFADLIDSTVSKVNNVLPDAQGNVTITNVSTASTITGSITKSQVTGLQTDLDAKVNTSTLKTVNGTILTNGPGNVVIDGAPVKVVAIPNADYLIGSNSSNAFPIECDRFVLASNKTYMLRGKYIIRTTGAASQTAVMSWAVGTIVVTSLEYVVTSFSSALNAPANTVNKIQISGISGKTINAQTALPTTTVEFEGVLRCTTGGGTFTPKLTFSTFPSGTTPNVNTMKVGSFIEFIEIGNDLILKAGPPGMIG